MTKEEIVQAISDDKMMPFIQPEQLAGIVNFVIKNYEPSLPSDLDEAAEKKQGTYLNLLRNMTSAKKRIVFCLGCWNWRLLR